jgi:drug/metabolite transporter (DMT)-like permease
VGSQGFKALQPLSFYPYQDKSTPANLHTKQFVSCLPPLRVVEKVSTQKQNSVQRTVVTGILLMLLAMTIIPIMDGLAKLLTADYPIAEVVWGRYFFHLLYLLPVVIFRYGPSALLPRHMGLQIIRGGLLLSSTIFFFAAIAKMPLADTLALVFIYPIIVTALSSILLGEKVGSRRWVAVLVGFLGALVIIRPGFNNIDPGTIYAIAAGAIYGLYVVATRKLSGSAPPLVTLTFTALLGALIMSAWVPFEWVAPNSFGWSLMAAMGACAALGHFLLIKALDHAPASVLAPFGYSEIIMATIIGFVVFGDFPDAITWLGVGVITSSGIYISLRERKANIVTNSFQAQGAFLEVTNGKETHNVNR